MDVYIITLFVISLLCIFYQYKVETHKKDSTLICVLIAAVLIFVSGFRYRVGTDYMNYTYSYGTYLTRDFSFTNQPALNIVAKISALIYNDYATWFFLMALITISLTMYAIKKYSINVPFSIILFILLGWWSLGFNIVKQIVAISIILCGFPFLRDKKFWKWCLVCFLATMFHISAILMIPVYFIVSGKFSRKKVLIMILFGIGVYLFSDYLFAFMEMFKETGQTNADSELGTREINPLRTIVGLAPIILFAITHKKYDYSDNTLNVLLNLTVLSSILSVITSASVYLARFALYIRVFNVLFIPYLLKAFGKRTRVVVFVIMFVLYAVFWLYDLNKSDATNVFQWIFNR